MCISYRLALVQHIIPLHAHLSVVLYRISPFHPLWRYPGPFWCRTTKFWHATLAATGEQPRYLQHLHDRYGEVVRFGAYLLSLSLQRMPTTVVRYHRARTTFPFETSRCSAPSWVLWALARAPVRTFFAVSSVRRLGIPGTGLALGVAGNLGQPTSMLPLRSVLQHYDGQARAPTLEYSYGARLTHRLRVLRAGSPIADPKEPRLHRSQMRGLRPRRWLWQVT